MKQPTAVILMAAASLFGAASAHADTISVTTTIPAPGPGQVVIASTLGSGLTFTASTNPNYYTDLYTAHANQIPAETFTTGSSATTLGSYTVLDADNGNGGFADNNTEFLVVATAAPNDGNQPNGFGNYTRYSAQVPAGSGAATGDYITYILSSPVPLAANTEYFIGWYSANAYSGFGVSPTGGTPAQDLAIGTLTTQNGGAYTTYSGVGGTPTAYPDSGAGTDVIAFQAMTPEPASVSFVAVAALALVARRRRKRS